MRRPGPLAALALPMLALVLAGCQSPFSPYTSSTLPEIRAQFAVQAYDSDANGRTDGIQLTLLSAQPAPPLVGSDVIIQRNGNDNTTVWQCPQREARLCRFNRGILSWDVRENIFIRGLPGTNRLHLIVRERFLYNTTVQVEETRDTEVWAVLDAREYDSDGNGTRDAIEINLVDSDKAPFTAGEVQVLVNQVPQVVFGNPRLTQEFSGQWTRGSKIFVDGFAGVNRLEVHVRATRYDPGTFQLGE